MACNDGSYGWGKRVTVRTRRKPCFFQFFSNLLLNQMQGSQVRKREPRGRHAFARAPGPLLRIFLSLRKMYIN